MLAKLPGILLWYYQCTVKRCEMMFSPERTPQIATGTPHLVIELIKRIVSFKGKIKYLDSEPHIQSGWKNSCRARSSYQKPAALKVFSQARFTSATFCTICCRWQKKFRSTSSIIEDRSRSVTGTIYYCADYVLAI